MKRELTASKPIEIKSGAATKTQERELSDVMEFMIDQISKRFRNTAINGIQAATVEKFADADDYVELVHATPHVHFTDHVEYRHYDEYGNELSDGDSAESAKVVKHELKKPHTTYTYSLGRIKIKDALSGYRFKDAQLGNYAAIFLKLAGKVTRMIMRQFDDKRLEEMVSGILDKVDVRSRDQFYSRIESAIGISSKELSATEGMKATTNALKLQTAEWVKKLRDETLDEYTANTLRAMSLGNGLDGILDQYDGLVEKRKGHARFTARNQINNYNSVSTKIRAQNLGITQAVWVTAGDERVRHSHEVRDGKTFDLDKGLYSSVDGKWLLPGTDYNCRCTSTYVIPESE